VNKKICFFTTYFYPEDFKGNDIAFELSKKGYLVTVITAIPNYPYGKYFVGYSLFKRRKETVNNVEIIRIPVIPRGNGSGFMLALNYLSYLIATTIFTFFFSFRKRFDAVFVQQLSPFFVAIPSVMMAKQQKIPLYFWVLDLWPESIQSAVGFKNKLVLNLLNKLVINVYKECTNILIGSEGYRRSILQKGDYNSKLIYFPNWAEDIPTNSMSKIDINIIFPFSHFADSDFILLFAGNIGEAQNIDALIESAKLTADNSEIKWVFIGDGRHCDYLKKMSIKYSLQDTVFFPGRFPLETMPVFMKRADILLVSLTDEPIFNLTVPSKMQFYMAQGKPILGMLNGDGAELIAKSQCGYCVPAGDYLRCAEIVKEIIRNKKDLEVMGKNGERYYNKYFQKKDRINQLQAIINNDFTFNKVTV
jgi:glycosyltransferase involved in cell wall biosynthesis